MRFNFRGVGTSTGSFDQGVGEKDDVLASLDWLEERHAGLPLVVGGFSFGSMVALSAGADDPRVVALFGLGLPVRMYDYGFLADVRKPTLVVQGDEDELGSGSEVEPHRSGLGLPRDTGQNRGGRPLLQRTHRRDEGRAERIFP